MIKMYRPMLKISAYREFLWHLCCLVHGPSFFESGYVVSRLPRPQTTLHSLNVQPA
jgi:hypothetical protein